MTVLPAYKSLLEDYHRAIDFPDWPDRLPPLIAEMDRLWPQLGGTGQQAALDHAEAIYEARIR